MTALPPFELNAFWIAQFTGLIALGFGIAAFSVKSNTRLKILQIIQSCFLSLNFYLLGALGGSAMTLLAAVRNGVSLLNPPKFTGALFMMLYLAIGYYRYREWYDILPVFAVLISTYAIFYAEGLRVRYLFLAVGSLWIIHNAVVLSIPPLVMEAIILGTNLRFILNNRSLQPEV